MSKEIKNKIVPKLRFPEFKNKNGWEEIEVGKIIEQHIEKTDKNKQYPVLTSSRRGIFFQSDYYNNRDVASEDTTGYNVVPKGYFTYRHMSDDLVFKFNINNICERGIVSTLYPVFSAKEEIVVPYFLQLILNEGHQFPKFAISQKQGGSRTYIYLSKLKELVINLPSLLEQQKIASCLSSLDELITAQSKKLEALKDHKKGLMQQLFPAEGEKVPKLRFAEFRDSGEWEEKSLGNICSNIASGKSKIDVNGEFDLYGSTGVIGKTNDYCCDGNFILVARVGANAGLLTRANEKFGVTDNTLIVSLYDSENINFIYYTLEKFGLNKLVFGSGQPLITGGQLKSLIINLPKSEEQQKIASCLSSLDDLIAAQAEKIEALKEHKKGLMQGVFPCLEYSGHLCFDSK